jgi:hypothetical protein
MNFNLKKLFLSLSLLAYVGKGHGLKFDDINIMVHENSVLRRDE